MGSSSRLNELITTYSSITEITSTISYEGNRYPEAEMPTGSDNEIMNPVPQQIMTSEARTSNRNRN